MSEAMEEVFLFLLFYAIFCAVTVLIIGKYHERRAWKRYKMENRGKIPFKEDE